MKKYRIIFYFLFFFFHVTLFTFSIYVESHKDDFNYLLKLQGYIQYMKYGTFLGLILVSVDYFMDRVEHGKLNKEILRLADEVNSWKAQPYDEQEGGAAHGDIARSVIRLPREPSGSSDQ